MSAKNSIRQTLIVALLVCLVCSVVVASSAVILKPQQVANKLLDRNKNILSTVGLFQAGETTDKQVQERFEQFEARFLDVRSGELLTSAQAEELGLDIDTYNQRDAAKNPQMNIVLTPQEDIASIGGSQAKYVLIYLLKEENKIKRIVLPVHGYGLWGTLYGFIAVESDGNTIAGLSFYEHKETPGLGAKVDLPKWKAQWPGKKIYGEDDQVEVRLAKNQADPASEHEVDGLSGATLTTRGVSQLLQFWMGDLGYKPFLKNVQNQSLEHISGELMPNAEIQIQ